MLHVGDEERFLSYEEKVVYDPLQGHVAADDGSNLEFGFDFSEVYQHQSSGMVVENEDAWMSM